MEGPGFLCLYQALNPFGIFWGYPMLTWRRLPYTSWGEIRPDRHAIGRRASSRRVGCRNGDDWEKRLVKLSVNSLWHYGLLNLAKVHPAVEIPSGCPGAPVGGVRGVLGGKDDWNFRITYYKTLLHHFGYVFNSIYIYVSKNRTYPFKVRFSFKSWTPRNGWTSSEKTGFIGSHHQAAQEAKQEDAQGRWGTSLDLPESKKNGTKEPWILGWLWMNPSLFFTLRFIRKKTTKPSDGRSATSI